ncbi:hypothetical protein GCM10022628_25710 [Anoxybacillus suryakundensis]
MSNKDKMISALKKIVVPELKSRGFKGSFPHFRKQGGSWGIYYRFNLINGGEDF